MRNPHILIPLGLVLLLGACTSASPPRQPAPEPEACREPLYLELKNEHPDSLSDRAWERLHQLEAECRAEQTRQAEEPSIVDGGYFGAWLWMPAMMVFGGMMWLMMGAF